MHVGQICFYNGKETDVLITISEKFLFFIQSVG